MGGLRCHACRRYVLRRAHVFLLVLAAAALVILLLGLFEGFLMQDSWKSY